MSNNQYLIKRNPGFTKTGSIIKRNSPRKRYTETIVTKTKKELPSKNLNPGDIIYVAESGYGIYAKGKVVEVGQVKVFKSIKEALDFYILDKKTDASYWIDKIIKLKLKKEEQPKSNYVIKYQPYIINQTLLSRTVPLESNLKSIGLQGNLRSFMKLSDQNIQNINNPINTQISVLNSKIPSSLRMDIVSLFNIKHSITHWIDIDHFVPSKIGGPGNIIENLVPIGMSLNRYKSDSIPSGVFEVAMKISDLKPYVPNGMNFNRPLFYPKNEFKNAARDIIGIVNSWKIERSREFYSTVLSRHYPEYWNIVKSLSGHY